jgi:glutamate/tyrosine decarboxylase-like PLP-dependent enzyme
MSIELFERAFEHARSTLESARERPVCSAETASELRRELAGSLPDSGAGELEVIDALAAIGRRGTVGSAGPRYFGFVTGGSLPAALAADWLTSTWDQNAAMAVMSPAASVVEETVLGWVRALLGLPESASGGIVTGCSMANFVALSVARHHLLSQLGWDVESQGLFGAPRLRVIAGAERHASIDMALRYAGFGTGATELVAADENGALRPEELARLLGQASSAPTIVCAQAGNVNTGACDALDVVAELCRARGAWLHVDGAFGLWAAASERTASLVRGVERCDSWATDGHKWLNVPYDTGFVFCAHPDSHRAAFASNAAYYVKDAGRDGMDFVPEASRRARAFPVWAALRSLGRRGVAELVERCSAHARRFAELLREEPGVSVLNQVVLNQVLVRFSDDDAITRAVIEGVQREGTCWAGGTTWRGRAAMRISVSNHSTTTEDVDRSTAAILSVHRAVAAERSVGR